MFFLIHTKKRWNQIIMSAGPIYQASSGHYIGNYIDVETVGVVK
jgi:hypothetical protein